MVFALTAKQKQAIDLQGSDATHVMLEGGSRSGKTFIHIRSIVVRALAHKSRHAILRFRFNHVKSSVVYDTLPKVMELCFPDVGQHCKLDKSDWFYRFPNGSEIWFGGLDDKERTEKILGQEYATIFLNECSQISWASRNMAMTRLAQKTELRLKAYYDCNPPPETHWTNMVFMRGLSPDTRRPLPDAENYKRMRINPIDNRENLKASYLRELDNLPERMRRRFRDGLYGSADENALWTIELIEQCRLVGELPEMKRIVVAVDPSGCAGEEDERSDEIGIVVCGLGDDGNGYVLEDLSGRHGPAQWAKIACDAYERHEADCIVAETNFGGAMVGEIVRAQRPGTPYREVKASRGKVVRAEPVAALYSQGRVFHATEMPELEDQLYAMTTAGYMGSKSPDRADAAIWGIASLFNVLTKKKSDPFKKQQTKAITGRDSRGMRMRRRRKAA